MSKEDVKQRIAKALSEKSLVKEYENDLNKELFMQSLAAALGTLDTTRSYIYKAEAIGNKLKLTIDQHEMDQITPKGEYGFDVVLSVDDFRVVYGPVGP